MQENSSDDEIQILESQLDTQPDYIPLNLNSDQPNASSTAEENNQVNSTQNCAFLDYTEEVNKARMILESIRNWDYTNLGLQLIHSGQSQTPSNKHLIFNVLSYNILAQELLEEHEYLYKDNDPRSLKWEHRKQLLFAELKESNADILCLQEVQETHINLITNHLREINFTGYFKRRTNDKPDGVAIFYKKDVFKYVDMIGVEYNQPGVPILNRDNVGIILRLAPKRFPNQNIVVVTTHLLYNPNRHDIKLAQLQLLFAEIDRIAFRFTEGKNIRTYWPIIFTGDLNFEPSSPLFNFITRGHIKFAGLSRRTLLHDHGSPLFHNILPEFLGITDMCIHEDLNQTRSTNRELKSNQTKDLIRLYNSEHCSAGNKVTTSYKDYVEKIRKDGLMNQFIPIVDKNEKLDSSKNSSRNYNTGRLAHAFHFRSAYKQDNQVTTFHNRWTTVDYIFYSCKWSRPLQKTVEGKLKLLGKYQLPSEEQAKQIGPIPNLSIPSDHYPLMATFLLQV